MLLNIYFYFSVNTRGYPWILKNYAGTHITDTNMNTGIRQIFIQQIKYNTIINCIVPVPLTSLHVSHTEIKKKRK